MEQNYYRFNASEKRDPYLDINNNFISPTIKKQNFLTNQRSGNIIGNLGLNIVNSVKHNKNYVLADDNRFDTNFKGYFNTPQRNQTKFSLLQQENKSTSLNRNNKKYINSISYNNHNIKVNVNKNLYCQMEGNNKG